MTTLQRLGAAAVACLLGWPLNAASALELRQTKWPGCRALTNGDFAHTLTYNGRRVFTGRGCPESWDNGQGGTEYSTVFDRIRIQGPDSAVATGRGRTCSISVGGQILWDCR